jgi:hypothetical protein
MRTRSGRSGTDAQSDLSVDARGLVSDWPERHRLTVDSRSSR